MSTSTASVDVTIAPNEKYRRVIGLYEHTGAEEEPTPSESGDDYEDWPDEHKEAADGYIETLDWAPTAEGELREDPEELDTLAWGLISVSSDPDLVAKMATYFDGIDPSEPTDRLRAKLRLLDCEVYVKAQVASRAELRD